MRLVAGVIALYMLGLVPIEVVLLVFSAIGAISGVYAVYRVAHIERLFDAEANERLAASQRMRADASELDTHLRGTDA